MPTATAEKVESLTAPKTPTIPPKSRAAQPTPDARAIASAVGNLKLVADTMRLGILFSLAENAKNVTAICAAMSASQPAVSHHLALLRVSGLVGYERQGKHSVYSLTVLGHKAITAARGMVG